MKREILRGMIFASAVLMAALVIVSPVAVQGVSEARPIRSINAGTIGQRVTISGRIVSVIPPTSERAPYSIYVTDETETLRVVVWRDVFDRIPVRDRIKSDARVRITGKIKEHRHNLNLYINSPNDVVILGAGASNIPPAPQRVSAPLPSGVLSPGKVNSSMLAKTVTVQGSVREYKPAWSERAPNSILLADDTGSLRVVYWGEVAKALGAARTPKPGQTLRIRGKVSEFRGRLQLKVKSASDIRSASAQPPQQKVSVSFPTPAIKPTPVLILPGAEGSERNPITVAPSKLNNTYIGKYVKMRGKVVDLNPSWKPTAPNTITLSDGIGSVAIVYWSDVAGKLTPEQEPDIGKAFLVEGKVAEYRGKIQVKLNDPSKLVALSPHRSASVARPGKASTTPEITPIGKINADLLNLKVTISGTITRIISVGGGRLLKVGDSTGTITVPFWDTIAEKCPYRDAIREGAKITLTGLVFLYEPKNEIEVKLLKGEDVLSVK